MPNRLASAVSPYLTMHSENPVDWYPWGEEALNKAKKENKPILLSIGYTACHWCHVMAHESFEDDATAEIMNRYFVNIKVDREERPDIDKIYQLAAQLLTRQVGGWPLTVFLMPDNHLPFFAGTYFPKTGIGNFPAFQEVLHYVHYLYTEKQEQVNYQNISFQTILNELEQQAKQTAPTLNIHPIEEAIAGLKQSFDHENGGFGQEPKFPMVSALERLLLANDESSNLLKFTLEKMTSGGLYDHLGGGFFRYTVDKAWQIPHFEKMLYDNALLLSILVLAHTRPDYSFLKPYLFGTAEWLLREMAAPNGGFYATLSADTDGQEGKYYIWSKEEIENALNQEEIQLVSHYYGLDQPPNFKHQWHFHLTNTLLEAASICHLSETDAQHILENANKKLLAIRNRRSYPARDEKIITAWNGLVIKAFALLGFYHQEEHYIIAAQRAVDFIHDNLWQDDHLFSVYKDGQVTSSATLDDYVFLIEGLFYLLQARWRTSDFIFLQKLLLVVKEQFEDHTAGGFYFTATKHEKLIYRMKQYADEAIPASAGVFTTVLQQLGLFLGDNQLLKSADKSLKNAMSIILQHPDFYCSFITALQVYFAPTLIIIVRGGSQDFEPWRKAAINHPQFNRFIFFIDDRQTLTGALAEQKSVNEKTIAYICEGQKCYLPIIELKEFEDALQRFSDRN